MNGRRRRKPTLSELDGDDAYPFDGKAWDYATGLPLKGGSKQDLPVVGTGLCWCGERYNHDWPGKEDGAPHPR